MSTALKTGITFGIILILLCFTMLFQIFSSSYQTYTTSASRVEILKYEQSDKSGITRVLLKNQNSDDYFFASVPDGCKFLPINFVVDVTVQRHVTQLLWFINTYSYRLVKGDVCQK